MARPKKPAKGDKPAKDGITALLTLAAGRPIPDTASTVTPTGGCHLFFRLPVIRVACDIIVATNYFNFFARLNYIVSELD